MSVLDKTIEQRMADLERADADLRRRQVEQQQREAAFARMTQQPGNAMAAAVHAPIMGSPQAQQPTLAGQSVAAMVSDADELVKTLPHQVRRHQSRIDSIFSERYGLTSSDLANQQYDSDASVRARFPDRKIFVVMRQADWTGGYSMCGPT